MASVGTDAEGQVTFLVHCIKHSSGGRVDFRSVANDCKIASKAAAAKRFERILRPYGMKTSDLSKNGPIGSAASPGGASASPKTPGRATPKAKGKRAPTETPTKETKRLKLANHPVVSSYNDEDDAEDAPQFKVKEDPEASGTDSANGSYNDIPRGRDDDDLQLLYVVEKTTSDCPIHGCGGSRNPLSTAVSSDPDTEGSMQIMSRPTSMPVYAWPDTCAIHRELEAAQLVGICE
ncbi:hypothetical protein CSAL01_12295 [Colletotrichum salicis]|uniref:Myb-like DNA-binding domain-containing protein n=1 Tax=Colletotrichum salicis TaxID=1209931 RepID=A0A135V0F8_9PEZI|nr:hypothetical protein CSAL01_12295 [Colletotrichum salicis]